jgi:uncharacterized protein YndB with AHSA1/START domain
MNGAKTLEVTVERTIPASPQDVFDAWLNPKIPGNPWHMADRLLLNPTVDGFFYWTFKGTPHYGRFTAVERAVRIEHTWMSPNTAGLESTVSVTFKAKGKDTLMKLVHSGLPETEGGRSHEKGWTYFLEGFQSQLAAAGAA